MKNRIVEIAKEIKEIRYKDADTLFLAGSIVRGEGTKYSDLDLVIIYQTISKAYRESFIVSRWVKNPQL